LVWVVVLVVVFFFELFLVLFFLVDFLAPAASLEADLDSVVVVCVPVAGFLEDFVSVEVELDCANAPVGSAIARARASNRSRDFLTLLLLSPRALLHRVEETLHAPA
jgi:hypothetical protein